MAQTRKLIHNLEKVADDMIDFIMNSKNNVELIELIDAARAEYKEPLESIIWWPIYVLFRFRVRGPELDQLADVARQHKAGRILLSKIIEILETGGKKSTSVRTLLVYELLMRLPNYQKVDPDPKASLTLEELKELRKVFKGRAKIILEAVKGDLTQEAGVKEELNNLPKRDIRQTGVQLPAGSLYKPKPQIAVNKLDNAKFGELKAMLSNIYQNRQALLPFTSNKVSPKVLTGAPDEPKKVAAPVVQEDTLESMIDIFDVIPTPPPPPPIALSVTKNKHEVYQAPPRKKFNEEQLQAAMSFFTPRINPVIIQGTCDDNIVSAITLVN